MTYIFRPLIRVLGGVKVEKVKILTKTLKVVKNRNFWVFFVHLWYITVFLSFLKRERERFPLFVPKRYCVTTRKFLGVLDRSTYLTVHRSWTVPWPFLKRSGTVGNGHGNINVHINGLKRLQNHVHVHVSKMKETL